MKIKASLVAWTVAFLLASFISPVLADYEFYLTTDEAVPSGKDPVVTLHSKPGGPLEFTYYRIHNPVEFVASSKDPERPSVEGTLARRWLNQALLDAGEGRETPKVHGKGKPGDFDPPPEHVFSFAGYTTLSLENESKGWAKKHVEFPLTSPGLYLVECVRKGKIAYATTLSSDLTLVVKRTSSELLAWTVNRTTGAPLESAEIKIFTDGSLLATTETGKGGLARIKVPDIPSLLVTASLGEDFDYRTFSHYPAEIPGVAGYLFTNLPLYRPGETVRFKGILREETGDALAIPPACEVSTRILDSRGQVVIKTVSSLSDMGSFHGEMEIPRGVPLGDFLLIAETPYGAFQCPFKVEKFKTPTMEVSIKPSRTLVAGGGKVKFKVSTRYFAGDPVKKGTIRFVIQKSKHFSGEWERADASWFMRKNEIANVKLETVLENSVEISRDGTAEIVYTAEKGACDYNLRFAATVVDDSGDSAHASANVRVTRASYDLHIKTDKLIYPGNDQARIEVKALFYGGQNAGGRKVSLQLLQPDENGNNVPLGEKFQWGLTTGDQGNAGAVVSLAVEEGVYLIEATSLDDENNSVTANKKIYVLTRGGTVLYKGDDISVIPSRRTYRAGDKARVLVIAPFEDASFLATVEGRKIHEARVVREKGNARIIEFPVTRELSPNFFITVSAVNNGRVFHETRSIVVPPEHRFLDLTLKPDKDTYKPREGAKIKVSVKDALGHPVENAEIALSVVDEAVLSLGESPLPRIEEFFYHLRRNSVTTSARAAAFSMGYALVSQRLPQPEPKKKEYSKKQAAMRRAGGASACQLADSAESGKIEAQASPFKAVQLRRLFESTACWQPSVKTDKNGKAEVSLRFPDNLTRWRIEANAVTADTSVARTRASVTTKTELITRLGLPGFLRERDEITIPHTTRNLTGNAAAVRAEVYSWGVEKLEGNSSEFIVGPNSSETNLYRFKASTPGQAVFKAFAQGKDISDGREDRIEILAHGITKSLGINGSLENGSASGSFQLPESASIKTAVARIRITNGPVDAISQAIPYMTGYPWGCTEQTLEKFVPDVLALKAFKKAGVPRKSENELRKMVSKGLYILKGYQHEDGGWGWWKDDSSTLYMTAFTVRSLAEALTELEGDERELAAEMIQKGAEFIKKTVEASPSPLDNSETTALAVLALILSGKNATIEVVTGSDILKEKEPISPIYLAFWALGFHQGEKLGLARGEKISLILADQIENSANTENGLVRWGDENATDWRRAAVETTAECLYALIKIKPESELVIPAVKYLLSKRADGHWRSTRDTAAVVRALSAFAERLEGTPGKRSASVTLNGKTIETGPEEKLTGKIFEFRGDELKTGLNELALKVDNAADLYFFSAYAEYFSVEEMIKPSSYDGLEVSRSVTLEEEEVGVKVGVRGKTYIVELKIKTDSPLEFVMLEDHLPAGAVSLRDEETLDVLQIEERGDYSRLERRPEKTVFFFDRLAAGETVVRYACRITHKGLFHAMPATASLMYFPEKQANSAEFMLDSR